tara:strand:- start:3444 stop:3677 length:234 start_codon:yes stop_codon:yes gene_type:complete
MNIILLEARHDLIEDIEKDLREIKISHNSVDSLTNNPSVYFKCLSYSKQQSIIIVQTGKLQKLVAKFNNKVESLKIK